MKYTTPVPKYKHVKCQAMANHEFQRLAERQMCRLIKFECCKYYEIIHGVTLEEVRRRPWKQEFKRRVQCELYATFMRCCAVGSKIIRSRLLKVVSGFSLSSIRARIQGLMICRDVSTVCVL